MKTQNICKFPASPYAGSTLTASSFVREADKDTMRLPRRLLKHRLLLFAQGKGSMRIREALYPFRAGTLLFAFAGESLSLEEGEDVVYMYVDFEGARADELLHRFGITPITRGFDGFDGLIPLWQESLARASDKTFDLAAESILLHSFSRLHSDDDPARGIVGQIAKITEQRFQDSTLSIAEIAKELSYHPKYISHLFKEKTGSTYSEYLRSVRLNYAIALFDHGIDSVKNVALLSGFSDPLYFSSVFKKEVSLSPKEYLRARSASDLPKA